MAYVYRHIRLDTNEVFYIGIGSDVGGKYIRAYSKTQRNRHWNYVSKNGYCVEILFDNLDWSEACEKEKEFIKLYGRKDLKEGTLVNKTNGGEGTVGVIVSEETKKKISAAVLGKPLYKEEDWISFPRIKKIIELLKQDIPSHTIEKQLKCGSATIVKVRKYLIKTKQIDENKTWTLSNETRKKISEASIGKKKSKESIDKMKINLKKYYESLSYDEKLEKYKYGTSMLGKTHKQSTKEKMSKASKGKPKSPEHVAKLREVWKKRKEDKISNSTNNFW
jgi:RNase H-fold protein (predicted Holliday junction resolvase)